MSTTVIVKVTPDCEGLISNMPRGYEYELTDEDYIEDNSVIITFVIHDVDEMTYAQELALDTHDGVISYKEKPTR
jgi:hypothetical protein